MLSHRKASALSLLDDGWAAMGDNLILPLCNLCWQMDGERYGKNRAVKEKQRSAESLYQQSPCAATSWTMTRNFVIDGKPLVSQADYQLCLAGNRYQISPYARPSGKSRRGRWNIIPTHRQPPLPPRLNVDGQSQHIVHLLENHGNFAAVL